jgi:anti-sigma B factor antagonist
MSTLGLAETDRNPSRDRLMRDAVVVCFFDGELVAARAAHTRQVLASLLVDDRVVLDLSETTFIDSAGLGALIGGVRRFREKGGQVVVSSCRPRVERLLRIVGFDRVVPLLPGLEEARATLDAMAAFHA